MKKHWLMSAAMLTLLSTAAWSADDAASSGDTHHTWTLEDARKHAHDYADKLDKMTPEEWAAKQQKRHSWRAKWKAMTPEEKEAYKKTHKRHPKDESSAAPAASTPAASASPVPSLPPTVAPPPPAAATQPSPPSMPPSAAPVTPNLPPAEVTAPPMPATTPSGR